MRKILLTLVTLLVPSVASANRYWITVPIIGSGATLQDARRPALGTLKAHASYAVAAANGSEALVLVVTSAGNEDLVKSIAARYHGQEFKHDGVRAVPIGGRLKAEAHRLGAADDWAPEGFDLLGD